MEVINDLFEFYCGLKCTDCTTLVSLVTLVTFILFDDLTKRTVRFGGDFSTVDYMFLEYRERKKREGIWDIQGIVCTDWLVDRNWEGIFPYASKQGACAQNGGKHLSMMVVVPLAFLVGKKGLALDADLTVP